MKDYNHIEQLLERYYDGNTSEAEEQTLKDFFSQEEIPSHLSAEKEMFFQFSANRFPQGMEERLEQLIDQWDTAERSSIQAASKHRSLRLRWVASIAASLLLLFGMSWYIHDPAPSRQDTFTNPEEAYIHAERALVLFSEALNKGIDSMESIERVENNIQKQLNKLNNREL